MMFKRVAVLSALLISSPIFAAPKTECRAIQWPFARNQSNKDIANQLEELNRKAVIEYFFYELTTTNRKLSKEISAFLIQTEQDQDLRSFFTYLTLDQGDATPEKLSLSEICSLYTKVLRSK